MFLQRLAKFRQSLANFSAIPRELFGNTLRALFLKNREFFCYGEIFLPNTRGSLGCLLGFWSSGPKLCGGKYCCLNLRLRQACGQWSSSLVFLYRVLAKTTLTITKTSFENKLLLICDYFAIALISYDRILHNVGDVRYNYGLVCPPMDQIQRGSLYAYMVISCCHKLNVHGIVLKCVPHVEHAYFSPFEQLNSS